MSDYEIGKGKPPHHSRFKLGNKEHLKRNKPKANPEAEIFKKVMSENIAIRKGRRVIYKSRLQLWIDRLFANALKGEVKAMEALITIHRNAKEQKSLTPIIIWTTEEDDAVL